MKRKLKAYDRLHPGSNNLRKSIIFVATVVMLTLFGLVMVYDASVVQAFKDYGDKYFYIKQQIIWVLLGLGSLLFFSFFNYHRFKKISGFIFIISFLMLLSVFIPSLGVSAGGAHRWLRIAGFTIQPAEIIKLTTIIFLAKIFEKRHDLVQFLSVTLTVSFILGILQKDLGSAIVYFFSCLVMYLIAGGPLVHFVSMAPFVILGFIGFVFTSDYRKQRILAFLNPFADPQGFSYHISQVLIALGSGGWFGVGLGQSRQKFEYIPEVTTDSIFAIVGEELGFIGSLGLIALFSFFIFWCFKIAEGTDDAFGKPLAFGLTSWLGIQAIVNLAAMVSLIPLTGVPLPFVSYGGSALLANLTAAGILLNISKSK